jgi:F-type H+-transporting ATPase subunit b
VLPYLPIAQVFIPFRIEHPEIFWSMLIGFALLLLLVVRVPIPFLSVPHYKQVLDERATRIETNKQQVDTAISEVQQLRNDYATRLSRIEEEARQRIDAAVREADAARAEIIAEAEQVAQAIRRRGEEEIARERTRQRILFRQQVVKTAMDSAEGAIRDHSDDTVQHRLIGDFIAQAAGNGQAPSNPRQEGA